MANWEPYHPPPRTSSRVPAPGIFVSVEFGVSFSNHGQPHTASMAYTSRRMQERLLRQRRQQEEHALQERDHHQRPEEADFRGPHPFVLMPGHGGYYNEQYSREHHYQPRRGLSVRTRDSRERGNSAPPSLSDRMEPISPISPVSPIGTWGTLQHTSSMPIGGIQDRMERPLPPLPSQFRLGEDGLPWTTEPWYIDPESDYESPTTVGIEMENRRQEDPQRVRDLGALQQAMMTVDSLPYDDGWEPWTWDSVGDMPRGPRSLGWAVRSEESRSGPMSPIPPPYVVSQWEQAFTRGGGMRPRSSG